jgi:hypothetical protein
MRTGLSTSATAKRLRPIGLAVAMIAALVGGATAGHLATDVKSYTGCVSKDGAIIKVKEGNAPSSACSGGQTEIHLSAGDITSISVGAGLTGGGVNGAVSIGLDAAFTLPQDCVAGEIVERSSSGWTCGDDDDTTYAAGTGLNLSAGNVFSLEPDNVVINGESCGAGEYVSGIGTDGHVNCATLPSATQIQAYATALNGRFDLGGTETVLALNAPAGNYLLFATVELANDDFGESTSDAKCSIPNFSTSFITMSGDEFVESVSLHSALTHPGGPINLQCTEITADVDIQAASFQALRIDAAG